MRDIKFRAWDKYNKNMLIKDWDFKIMPVSGVAKQNQYGEINATPDLELMQYTGLKDKNGKEIYEGDIVGVNAVLGHGYGRKIMFRKGAFGFEAIPNISTDLCYLEVWTEDVEVIGNIYENPDLLKA